MELLKTTILPTDEKKLALHIFRQLIFEKPHVILVVCGRGPDAETFVQRADRLTFSEKDPRWVVWARKPEQIKEVIDQLKDPQGLRDTLRDSRGFSLSLTDELRDVILGSEPVPSLMRIDKAFTKAETKT